MGESAWHYPQASMCPSLKSCLSLGVYKTSLLLMEVHFRVELQDTFYHAEHYHAYVIMCNVRVAHTPPCTIGKCKASLGQDICCCFEESYINFVTLPHIHGMCNFIIKSDSVYEIKGKRGKEAYLVWALATEHKEG